MTLPGIIIILLLIVIAASLVGKTLDKVAGGVLGFMLIALCILVPLAVVGGLLFWWYLEAWQPPIKEFGVSVTVAIACIAASVGLAWVYNWFDESKEAEYEAKAKAQGLTVAQVKIAEAQAKVRRINLGRFEITATRSELAYVSIMGFIALVAFSG